MATERSFGLRPSSPDKGDEKYRYYLPGAFLAALPTEYSVKHLFPPCYDQNGRGNCVSQATKGLMAANYTRQGMTDPVLSALMLDWMAREIEGTLNEDSGCSPRDAFKAANQTGICREDMWPHPLWDISSPPTPNQKNNYRDVYQDYQV